jgi:hypothetical protein
MTTRMIAQTGFIEDIKPLFTQADRDCMLRFVDLWDWNDVRKSADKILQRLRVGDMPPGGWPDEKIKLFEKWVNDYCPKYRGQKYFDYFVDLDAHTEYWNVYDVADGRYMNAIIQYMRIIWTDWMEYANFENEPEGRDALDRLKQQLLNNTTKDNLLLTNELMKMLIEKHFSDGAGNIDLESYFDSIERFALDIYPEDEDRYSRITNPDDFRKVYAKYHRMDGEELWFIWIGQNEWSSLIDNNSSEYSEIRKLQIAGALYGVCLDYTFRDDRSAKAKKIPLARGYKKDERTLSLLRRRALGWYRDFNSAVKESHQLIQIYSN